MNAPTQKTIWLSLGMTAAVLLPSTTAHAAACGAVTGNASNIESDFDGNGYSDVVALDPQATAGGVEYAGLVQILYGSSDGVTTNDQILSQSSPGVPGGGEPYDRFGGTAASGDFDGDGYCDLAVGVSGESVGASRRAGAINVFYGSPQGLRTEGSQMFSQNSSGIAGTSEYEDLFGSALATGNFGRGSQHDLAIGVPWEDDTDGRVYVLYGSASGLVTTGSQVIRQGSDGFAGTRHRGECGSALAAGRMGRSAYYDLAIGCPTETIDGVGYAGVVHVIYGSSKGLTSVGDQIWSVGSPGIEREPGQDYFGEAVAIGNFGKGSTHDLAVGASGADLPGAVNAGEVHIIYGTSDGLTARGNEIFDEQVLDITGDGLDAEYGDSFGEALTAANFGFSSEADLAVAVHNDEDGAGGVDIIYGASTGGLGKANARKFTQDTPGVKEAGEHGDSYSMNGVVAANFGHSSYADLLVAVPFERITELGGGVIQILYGTSQGISTGHDQLFSQDTPGIKGVVEDDDRWGYVGAGLFP